MLNNEILYGILNVNALVLHIQVYCISMFSYNLYECSNASHKGLLLSAEKRYSNAYNENETTLM